MRRVLGLLTEDFRLYHDLVAALKRRGVPFVSLSFSRRAPGIVGAILTSPASDSARIFRMSWPRWTLMVTSLVPSFAAICLFSVIACRIPSSRS